MTAPTEHTPTVHADGPIPEALLAPGMVQAAAVVPAGVPAVVEPEPVRPGLLDTIRSFTGYDEIAIKRAFGVPGIDALEETMLARAAFFVLRRRAGDVDDQAMVAAMSASIADVRAKFSDTEQDDDTASTPEG